MEVEIVVNGDVTLVLIPKNSTEEELVKELAGQDNEISLIRGGTNILSKSIPTGIIVRKKTQPIDIKSEDEEISGGPDDLISDLTLVREEST